MSLPPHHRFPYGHDESDHQRPWLDDEQPHRAGDDDPERLACRQCGRHWDEPRLSPDGVCPLCRADLEER